MSDDLLAGIEDVVDDFCGEPLNKINSNIDDEVSLSSSKTSNSWSSLSSRLERPEFEREYMGAFPRFYPTDMNIKCDCGVRTNITVMVERPEHLYGLERGEFKTDDLYCANCGRLWRTTGTVLKIDVDLFEERRRSNDRNERNRERWF